MKYFKCSVCGYIHAGQNAPAQCPVCGAPREKFEAMADEEGAKAFEEYKAKMIKRWDKIMARLAEIEKEEQAAAPRAPETKPEPAPAQAPPGRVAPVQFIFARMAKYHAHPIAVHFPNGIMPAAVLFLFLALAFQLGHMKEAAFYNLLFVTLVMPGVLFAGYVDWRVRMGGTWTRPILTKIIAGSLAQVTGIVLVVWYLVNPDVAAAASPSRWTYFLVNLLMLAFIGLAGYLGGELVFKD
jgi:uncharacterized membrane protein/uncharacterized Zn finger protein (UPF0148 family)